MESKDVMELVDRLLLLTEENTRLREQLDRLKRMVWEDQEAKAEMAKRYQEDNINPFDIYIDGKDILKVFHWGNSPKVVSLMEEKDAEG